VHVLRRAAAFLETLPAQDVHDVVALRLARAVPTEPLGLLAQTAAIRDLATSTPLRPRHHLATTLREDGDRVVVGLTGREVALPVLAAPALRRLLEGPCTPADLLLDGLDEPGALVLARRMLREGVVVPA